MNLFASIPKAYNLKAFCFSCLLFLAGLICSKFLITLGLILMLVAALFQVHDRETVVAALKQPILLSSFLSFGLISLSSLGSEHLSEGFGRIRIALPFLTIPLSLAFMPQFGKQHLQKLTLIFGSMMAIALAGVLLYYGTHYEECLDLLRRSKAIPTPTKEHIRFSLMLVLAIFGLLWLKNSRFSWGKRNLNNLYIGLSLFLIIGLHILSVRSGVLGLYGGIGTFILYIVLEKKHYIKGSLLLLAILVTPFIAYKSLDSVQAKVDLTVYNIQLMRQGIVGEYSDAQRLLSYKTAWTLYKENPILGTGLGDIYADVDAYYKQNHPTQRTMLPHNQFLSILLGTGLLGLLAFTALTFTPFISGRKEPIVLLFGTVLLLSFMTENTLFSSLGTGIYVFFGYTYAWVLTKKRVSARHADHSKML
jgi:O-antigen ligase